MGAVFIFRSVSQMQNKPDRWRTTGVNSCPHGAAYQMGLTHSAAAGTLKEFHLLRRRSSEGNTNYFPFSRLSVNKHTLQMTVLPTEQKCCCALFWRHLKITSGFLHDG